MRRLLIKLTDVHLQYPLAPLRQRSIKQALLRPFDKPSAEDAAYVEALRGVSFSVSEGERLGIVGANGAGKSTLLRLMAGIYTPTSGSLHVSGTPRSLFDLGVGFESEDTGRENIYYRGFLMGYSREQLKRLEASIIAFSGLETRIDMPLKSYSAGMQVRLAFSISTAIASDILLIDEVIGAGDAEFQKRAKERVSYLVRHAGCVVLVSHDLNSICDLCDRAVWLESGTIKADGPSKEVTNWYMQSVSGPHFSVRSPVLDQQAAVLIEETRSEENDSFAGDEADASSVQDVSLEPSENAEDVSREEPIAYSSDDRNDHSSSASAQQPLRFLDMVRTQPFWPQARCSRVEEGVLIVTSPELGSYSIEAPLLELADEKMDREILIFVSIKVTVGRIGVGILDKSYQDFIVEEVCETGSRRIMLSFNTRQSPSAVMFRNYAANGVSSEAIIENLSLFAQVA